MAIFRVSFSRCVATRTCPSMLENTCSTSIHDRMCNAGTASTNVEFLYRTESAHCPRKKIPAMVGTANIKSTSIACSEMRLNVRRPGDGSALDDGGADHRGNLFP